jgi:hypothetical protein
LAGRECKLGIAATAGNYVRVWCTDAPPGSKLRSTLDSSGATQVSVGEGDAGRSLQFTADKGGAYVFRVEEITRGASAYGGVYDTDPNKAPAETLLAHAAVTLYFASPLTCLLGIGQDTAELLLHVLDEQIIATTADLHGVVSPALRSTRTGAAKVAAESAAVRAAVQQLVGLATAALGNVTGWLDSLLGAFNAHCARDASHFSVDTANPVPVEFLHAATTEGQKRSVAALRKSLDNHMRNDNPAAAAPGTGSAGFHNGAGGKVDWANIVLPTAPSDQLSVLVSAADAYRAFEGHRISGVHSTADNTNAAPTPPPLLALHIAFVRQLATQSPVNPANEHPAKSLLLSGGGFKEA